MNEFRSKEKPTNYEAQGLCLTMTLAPREHVLDLDALIDVLTTHTLPGYEGTRVGGEIALGEDVVRDVCQTLALEVRQVKTDALGRSELVHAVHILVMHPNGLGSVRYINIIGQIPSRAPRIKKKSLTDDKVDSGLGGVASTAREQVLDGAAGLQTHSTAVLPPGDRAPLGVNKPLLEDVVEDVLKVEQVRSIADVDKLSSDLLVRTRRLVVGDPELSALGLSAKC